ncbi:MAG: glycogen synthase [Herbinix sp.]|nr:glycogen synthase [Herbinix sp.]
MNHKIKILYVTAEIAPFASAGGLGLIGESLPRALQDTKGIEVCRVMPHYKSVEEKLKFLVDFPVPMGTGYEGCVLKADSDRKKFVTYFIQNDRYFYRDNIYGYEDDGFRFFFFCQAVVEMLEHISFEPDIIHCNDWHTGFLPLLLKRKYPNLKTLYTIHNIAYHGFVPDSMLTGLLTDMEKFQLGWPEWLNFMKAGILYADRVSTVSPSYSKEITQPGLGSGMERFLRMRKEGIAGILNGIDQDAYDPMVDLELTSTYSSRNFEDKKKNKSALLSSYQLSDTGLPLIAIVTRLVPEKGIDLILKAFQLMDMSAFQFILLGTGGTNYHDIWYSVAKAYPDNIVVDFEYTPAKARKIYAACDIYLMPSQYEPCGLGQLYAMRYGAVPVINPVGGLKDTIVDNAGENENPCGFHMENWTADALADALDLALETYHSPEWPVLVKNCMTYDSSWGRSVKEYKKLYEEIITIEKEEQ